MGKRFKGKVKDAFKKIFVGYPLGVVTGVDHAINGFLAGNPKETISSRLGRALRTGKAKRIPFAVGLSNFLDKLDDNHALNSIDEAAVLRRLVHHGYQFQSVVLIKDEHEEIVRVDELIEKLVEAVNQKRKRRG
jgi:hypothetical protein